MTTEDHLVRARSLAVALALTLSLCGCATVFRGTGTSVSIASEPPGAEVWIGDQMRAHTPCRLHVTASHDVRVELRKPGFATEHFFLAASLGAEWLVLDAVTGVLGLAIDASTGAWTTLSPDDVHVRLHAPSPLPPEAPAH